MLMATNVMVYYIPHKAGDIQGSGESNALHVAHQCWSIHMTNDFLFCVAYSLLYNIIHKKYYVSLNTKRSLGVSVSFGIEILSPMAA